MTVNRILVLVVLSAIAVTSCVYRTDESHLDEYLEDVSGMESTLTTELESLLLDYPVVYDDTVAAQSSPTQIANGYVAYYSVAIPHVGIAIAQYNDASPPEDAVVFHELLGQWLEETKNLMEDGLVAFRDVDQTGIVNVLGRMATLYAKRDLIALEFDALND